MSVAEDGERRVLVQATAYDDGTGVLETAAGVSDQEAADYLLHLAGVAERGEHRQPPTD